MRPQPGGTGPEKTKGTDTPLAPGTTRWWRGVVWWWCSREKSTGGTGTRCQVAQPNPPRTLASPSPLPRFPHARARSRAARGGWPSRAAPKRDNRRQSNQRTDGSSRPDQSFTGEPACAQFALPCRRRQEPAAGGTQPERRSFGLVGGAASEPGDRSCRD